MAKYRIKDENNNEFEIEEVVDTNEEQPIEEDKPITDEDGLSAEDIAALKLLAASAKDLLELVKKPAVTDEEPKSEDKEEEEEEKVADGCKDAETKEEEDVEEEIKKANDSKAAFGSTKAKDKKVIVNDADIQVEIAEAWRNRGKK